MLGPEVLKNETRKRKTNEKKVPRAHKTRQTQKKTYKVDESLIATMSTPRLLACEASQAHQKWMAG